MPSGQPPVHRFSSLRDEGVVDRGERTEPKKPLCADNGLGCVDSTVGKPANRGARLRASRPQSKATRGLSRSAKPRMACSVTASHPFERCEPALPCWTVRHRLSSSTPWSAHGVRSPHDGGGRSRSAEYSRKMFSRLRGSGRTSDATEKLSPTAWPGVG